MYVQYYYSYSRQTIFDCIHSDCMQGPHPRNSHSRLETTRLDEFNIRISPSPPPKRQILKIKDCITVFICNQSPGKKKKCYLPISHLNK